MKAILFLSFVALISINSSSVSTAEADQCHSAFDLGPSENHSLDITVSPDKIISLEKAYISYNHCTNEREERIDCNTYRLIIAPKDEPASLRTINDAIPETSKLEISMLQTGDRVILEGLSYNKAEEKINLKPIVFTIE